MSKIDKCPGIQFFLFQVRNNKIRSNENVFYTQSSKYGHQNHKHRHQNTFTIGGCVSDCGLFH